MKTKVACHVPRFNIKHLTYYALVTNYYKTIVTTIFVKIESLLDILSNRILHPLGIFALLILAPNNIQFN